ncbi:MAG: response regulator [Lentisphaerae bacterium]|nr:response regulator [Lentisphaerota bacterium]
MFGLAQILTLVGATAVVVLVIIVHLKSRQDYEQQAAELAEGKATFQERNKELDRANRSLRLNEKWYRNLFDTSGDMVIAYTVTDDAMPGNFVDANSAACERLEYERDKLLTMSPLDVETVKRPGSDNQPGYTGVELLTLSNVEILGRDSTFATRNIQLLIRQVLKEGHATYTSGYVTHSGKMIPVEIAASRTELNGRPVIVCISHDVTTRRRAEFALRESEQRFEDFFDNSPIGAVTYDGNKEILDVNSACLRMFGVPERAEFAKFNPFDNPFVPDAARQSVQGGANARYEAAVDFDEVKNLGLFVTSRAGKAHFDVLINSLGMDHDFNSRGHLVQIQDISQRRTAEASLREREGQLRQAQKMEAIGTLAGGIAHDFNNILTPILGYAEMAVDRCSPGSDMRDYMEEIANSSYRARELVSQILIFSRQTDSAGHPIRISSIVKEVMKQQRTTMPQNIELTTAIKTDRDLVLANPTQIHQVLTNLCTNAAFVMKEDGGELDVRMTSFMLGYRHRREFPQLEHGRYLRVSIRDSGGGMDTETAERVFEPFFTTKPSGEGTGMGLAVVHGIITSLGGAIALETAPGIGTVFHVVLPSIEETPEKVTEVVEPLPSGHETVLFVDDEPVIVKMAGRMLESLGYEPVVTCDSIKALEMFEQNPNRFDLVITDQVMPELTGAELSQKLLGLRPELPIVMCTGFSEKMSAEQAANAGIREYVMKPIARKELAETIRRALDTRRTPEAEPEGEDVPHIQSVSDEIPILPA